MIQVRVWHFSNVASEYPLGGAKRTSCDSAAWLLSGEADIAVAGAGFRV